MSYQSIITVLIVDDEEPLRKELSSYPWGDWGAELIGEARNGEEALEFCENCEPDLVITDVTMPAMNGIVLLQELKRRFPRIQVVLLTVHRDFGYAKEAIRQEALDYLVKSNVEEEDLKRILRKTDQAINKESLVSRNEREERRWKCSQQLHKFLNPTSLEHIEDNWDQFRRDYDIGADKPFVLVHLNLLSLPIDELYASRTIQNFLLKWEQQSSPSLKWISLKTMEYILFVHQKTQALVVCEVEEIVIQMKQSLTELFSYSEGEIDLIAAVSDPIHLGAELKETYLSNLLWEDARFYTSGQAWIYSGAPEPLRNVTPDEATTILGMFNSVSNDRVKFHNYLSNDFVHWAQSARILPKELKELVLRAVIRWQLNEGAAESDKLLSRELLQQTASMTELVELLQRQYDLLFLSSSRNIREEVARAKKIIDVQYAEPITLSSIAEQVGELTAAYLGKLFREELGESFNEYVSKIRIKKAIALLKQGKTKVYEVAERVGIPNYRYFSLVFRKHTGYAPSDYKKANIEMDGFE